MSKINACKGRFSRSADPFFNEGVSGMNCFLSIYAKQVRQRGRRVDGERFTSDRSKYIFAKKNVDGLRR